MKYFSLTRQSIVILILRISLAFVFLCSAFLGYIHSFEWIGYFPSFIRDNFPDTVVLNIFGLSEIILAGWFLWGKIIFIPSLIACLYLIGSVLFNLDQFDELFRNIPILGIALALAIKSYPRIILKSKL